MCRSRYLLLICCYCCLLGNSTITTALPATTSNTANRHIHFGGAANNSNNCFLDNNNKVKGVCRLLSECATALELLNKDNVKPKTCYYRNNKDHFVCCKKEAPVLRISEKFCNSIHSDFKSNQLRINIVGGSKTHYREFPFMAALGWKDNVTGTTYNCGGVLIAKNFVLTSAHCTNVNNRPPNEVRIGGFLLNDAKAINIPVKQIFVHGKFKLDAYNDIALIKLKRSVNEQPACLWTKSKLPHNKVVALGYGQTKFAGAASNELLKVNLQLIGQSKCQTFYPASNYSRLLPLGIANSHVCAEDPMHKADTCQGDSGGPLIMSLADKDLQRSYVIGITTMGQGCLGITPSVYTRSNSYIAWIEDIVWPVKKKN